VSKKKRYLITTADEHTWKFDRPVIFLGEWCRVFNRKHVWQDMDAIVHPPYGLGASKKDADYVEARTLEDMLFPLLCNTLNEHHGVQHNERFWQIVLGHWLRRYVDAMLNRFKTLEQCLQVHEISGYTAYANNQYHLATLDSHSAIWALNDDRWNNELTVRMLDLLGVKNIPIELIGGCSLSGFRVKVLSTTPTLKKRVIKCVSKLIGKLARLLVRNNDAFIVNSYLPKIEEIKLQLALGQCPQLRDSSKFDTLDKPDRRLRKELAKRLISKSDNNLEYVVRVMVFELLPVCYLEGFLSLNVLVKRQPWPQSPKFIFTSNNFDTDEVFKLWAATKAELGSKYLIGQHGNNYGTHRFMCPTLEELSADKFLTWGWTDGLSQHVPAFLFKSAGRKTKNYNPLGGLLLVELHADQRLSTWDGTFEFANYFMEQQDFVNKLAFKPKQNLIIRLHGAYRYLSWNEEARWQKFDSEPKINTGNTSIIKLISQSRLVVHSYDSTGILETLSQNIPTLAFWQNGFEHLRESAKPDYQLLVDAGIVHFTATSASQKVNEIWDDVDGWWAQSNVQDARKRFCNQYARVCKNPVSELRKIIRMAAQ
jgi:putative transferase (TIGR04331 family)